MTINRLPKLGQWILFLTLSYFHLPQACAGDYRLLVGFGFGGSGISQENTDNPSIGTVKRSEGPGVATLGLEKILSDHVTLSFDHSRGFRLGPFSSGLAFTGFSGRYYLGSIPWGSKEAKGEPTLFIKRPHAYVGLGAGVAQGTIIREGDIVPTVTASGIYVGFRGGADIPLNSHGFGIRPELMMSGSFASSKPNPSKLTLVSLGCQVYFQL